MMMIHVYFFWAASPSKMTSTSCQNFPTDSMLTLSSGEWAPSIVGPKLTWKTKRVTKQSRTIMYVHQLSLVCVVYLCVCFVTTHLAKKGISRKRSTTYCSGNILHKKTCCKKSTKLLRLHCRYCWCPTRMI